METMKIDILYPGASAEDIELNVLIPVEEELKKVSGIDEYSSYCVENNGSILIVLDDELEDTQKVKDEIFRKISKTLGTTKNKPARKLCLPGMAGSTQPAR